MKAIKTKLQEEGKSEEEVKAFEKGAQSFVKDKLLPNFKDFEFYTGESMNPDGMIALLNYRYVSPRLGPIPTQCPSSSEVTCT